MAAPILWVIAGAIYCIYKIAKDANGGSGLNGLLVFSIVAIIFGVLYAIAALDAGWIVWPAIFIVIPLILKVYAEVRASNFDEAAYQKWLKTNEPFLTKDEGELDALSFSDRHNHYVLVKNIQQTIVNHKAIMVDDVPAVNKLCSICIPIGWGVLPITYCSMESFTIYDSWSYALVGLPLIIAASYIKLYIKK